MGIVRVWRVVNGSVVGFDAWNSLFGISSFLLAGATALYQARADNLSLILDAALLLVAALLVFASVYFFNAALPSRKLAVAGGGGYFDKLRVVLPGQGDSGIPDALWAPQVDILPGSATLEYQWYDEGKRQWAGRAVVPLDDSGRWKYALFGGYRAPLFRRGDDGHLHWGAEGPPAPHGKYRGTVTITPVSGAPARRLFSLSILDTGEVSVITDDLFEFIDEWAEEDRVRSSVKSDDGLYPMPKYGNRSVTARDNESNLKTSFRVDGDFV